MSVVLSYAQIPWFRRRWFVVLSLLLLTPVAAVLAFTGDLFYAAGGEVKQLPDLRPLMAGLSLVWLVALVDRLQGGELWGVVSGLACVIAAVVVARRP